MGGSKPMSCLELAWLHTWYFSSKMPGLWLCRSDWDWTYPWPTWTNLVYLVIGSPLFTMPPERNEIQHNHFRNAAPLSGCEPSVGNNSNRGSSKAQMAPQIFWFSTALWRVTLTGNKTPGKISNGDRNWKKNQVPKQEFVFYKDLGEREHSLYFPEDKHFVWFNKKFNISED